MRNLNIYSTRPKPPYGRQGLAGSWGKDTARWAGTFWCAIYSAINSKHVVRSLANNRSKYTKEKSFIREGIMRKMCCTFGFCPKCFEEVMIFCYRHFSLLTGGSNRPFRCLDFLSSSLSVHTDRQTF